jgi:hypothetical protein
MNVEEKDKERKGEKGGIQEDDTGEKVGHKVEIKG